MVELDGESWFSSLGLLGFVLFIVAVVLTVHVVLRKRDERSAVAWVGVIWLAPVVGLLAYLIFGINRIHRRASRLRPDRELPRRKEDAFRLGSENLTQSLPASASHLFMLAKLGDRVTQTPLTPGNKVTPLMNGETAFPAMLEAIDRAEHCLALATYIFNHDEVGTQFVEALERAVKRGVEVRVLVDGIGSYYSWPPIIPALQRSGVPTERFLHSFMPWRMPFLNLRNHQKILVADGCIGFTGGMNIKQAHLVTRSARSAVQDIHFRLEGPVVTHLMESFADDWSFTTGEQLTGKRWFPEVPPAGSVVARGVQAGPDEGREKLRWTLLGAISSARHSIKIVTPYFLPDQALIGALSVAAMSGVAVDVVIPAKSNLAFIDWAATPNLEEMLESGVRIWVTPPPFDHSKLFLVDGHWALIGSTNWDPRSIRLNFELNVECFDRALTHTLDQVMDGKITTARSLTLEDVTERSLPTKLRDGVARLFTPYL